MVKVNIIPILKLGLGFGFLAYGSMGINADSVVRVSMFADCSLFIHTLGELCIR
jgi:POT family proton-dependent oligopeptide transporter